jgi:hypothetical protein
VLIPTSAISTVLLFILYKKFKGRFYGKREDLEANNLQLEQEDKKTQQVINSEKSKTKEDSSSPGVVVLSPLTGFPRLMQIPN